MNQDPVLAPFAWQRRWEGETAYSLCGITHTTCTQAVLDAFGQLAIAPLHPWDAVICTSQSVRSTIERVLHEWSKYLTERLGANRRPEVELPVIPLGVDCDHFDSVSTDEKLRKNIRKELGIAKGDIAFLFFGRLSYHAKSNPFPMYRALQEVSQKRNGNYISFSQDGSPMKHSNVTFARRRQNSVLACLCQWSMDVNSTCGALFGRQRIFSHPSQTISKKLLDSLRSRRWQPAFPR